jgi:hypothetical protein
MLAKGRLRLLEGTPEHHNRLCRAELVGGLLTRGEAIRKAHTRSRAADIRTRKYRGITFAYTA